MSTALFCFHGELSQFLARPNRGSAFAYRCARAANLKNAIEALGVPHTEVGIVTVNGEPATLQRTVREGDSVEVYPPHPEIGSVPVFLADAHLGGLARFLRMLGFDTLHDGGFADQAIRRIAEEEGRIVLTRDRELLKCREIARGCYVHALKPQAQLAEVAALLPDKVRQEQQEFVRCAGCERIYWPGSHYRRMCRVLEQVTGFLAER